MTGSDAAARRTIAGDLEGTLFVEAGAGTGKTTALVGRIVALVGEGRAELATIAAITFTEAAAAELRQRVRRELETAEAAAGHATEERRRYRVALEQLDEAALSTIHSFARRILSGHAVEAGLPPAFAVLDAVEATIEAGRRWSAFVDRLFDDPALDQVLAAATVLGLRVEHLRLISGELHERWDLLVPDGDGPGPEAPPGPVPSLSPADLAPLRRLVDEVLDRCPSCSDPADRMLALLENDLRRWADRLDAATDTVDVIAALGAAPGLRVGGTGRATNWPAGELEALRARLGRIDDTRLALLGPARSEVLGVLVGRLVRYTLDEAERRRNEGRLEFHDLLVLARDLLRSRPAACRAVRAELSHLLVDEFQDTDPLQAEIALLLAEDPATGMPEPGRLFLVGDPRQSIYRFRRADVVLYRRLRDRFAGHLARLTSNHRSLTPVLAWVNAVFPALGGTDGEDGFAPLQPQRGAGRSRVLLLGDEADEPVAAIRAREAAEVAALIAGARSEGWAVADGRPLRYDDVAILLPTRTGLSALERALDIRGIPYRVESRSLVWATQEVCDLLAILASVDDPGDQVSLAAALRSPSFACGDDDLLSFRLSGGRWDYRLAPPTAIAADHPVAAAMAALADLHERRRWLTVSQLVDAVVRERHMLELAFAHRRQRESWARVRFLADQARAFVDNDGGTLRHFVEWARGQADERATALETVVPEADDEAVRITTIHAAKGLEYPMVVLAGLSGAAPPPATARALWSEEGHPEVRVGSRAVAWETDGFAALEAEDRRLDQEEAVRLLYVAATRARDHLVVSLHRKAGVDGCAAARLTPACALFAQLAETVHPTDGNDAVPAGAGSVPAGEGPAAGPGPGAAAGAAAGAAGTPLQPDPAPAVETDEVWLERRGRELVAGLPPVVLAATALDERAPAPGPFPPTWGPADEPAPPAAGPEEEKGVAATPSDQAVGGTTGRGRDGTAFGRAVHGVLQTVDLASGGDVESLAHAQAAAEGIAQQGGDVAAAARAALGSASVRRAVRAGPERRWREVYLAAEVGGALLEGFVDLLYEEEDALVVVDYKTDAVAGPDGVDRAVLRHRLQVGAYALLAERTTGRPVRRGELVFASPEGLVERAVPDLRGAMAEAERRLEATRLGPGDGAMAGGTTRAGPEPRPALVGPI